MKAKVVTLKEITNENPIMCLYPLRYLRQCHKCDKFKISLYKTKDIDKAIARMKCKPTINKEFRSLYKKKRNLINELEKINKKLEDIR